MIKKLLMTITIFTLAFFMTACSNNDKEEDKVEEEVTDINETTENTTLRQDLLDIENKVNSDIAGSTTYSRDKIEEAIDYIDENIENVKDKSVAKKLYEYGSYLEAVGNKGNITADNEIKSLGRQTKVYASNVYLASTTDVDNIIDSSKSALITAKDKVIETKDDMIDAFHKLINGE